MTPISQPLNTNHNIYTNVNNARVCKWDWLLIVRKWPCGSVLMFPWSNRGMSILAGGLYLKLQMYRSDTRAGHAIRIGCVYAFADMGPEIITPKIQNTLLINPSSQPLHLILCNKILHLNVNIWFVCDVKRSGLITLLRWLTCLTAMCRQVQC